MVQQVPPPPSTRSGQAGKPRAPRHDEWTRPKMVAFLRELASFDRLRMNGWQSASEAAQVRGWNEKLTSLPQTALLAPATLQSAPIASPATRPARG